MNGVKICLLKAVTNGASIANFAAKGSLNP